MTNSINLNNIASTVAQQINTITPTSTAAFLPTSPTSIPIPTLPTSIPLTSLPTTPGLPSVSGLPSVPALPTSPSSVAPLIPGTNTVNTTSTSILQTTFNFIQNQVIPKAQTYGVPLVTDVLSTVTGVLQQADAFISSSLDYSNAATNPNLNFLHNKINNIANNLPPGNAPVIPAVQIDEETAKAKARLDEQAFLMTNWEEITKQSSSESKRFTQFAQIDSDEPGIITNKLFQEEIKCDIFLKAGSAAMSYFVPKIRLFKELKNEDDSFTTIEFPLNQPYTTEEFESMYLNKSGRGGGAGIKSFNWITQGKESGNRWSFKGEIEFFFESIEEICKIRRIDVDDGKKIETSFLDLLLQSRKQDLNNPAEYNPDYFRIKAMLGWHVPKSLPKDLFEEEFLKEIKDSNTILYLVLHSHDITFNDDSSINLKIIYNAYVESFMSSNLKSDIFSIDQNVQNNINYWKTAKEAFMTSLNGRTNLTANEQSGIEIYEKQIEKFESEGLDGVYSKFLNYIYKPNPANPSLTNIKYAFVNEAQFQTYTSMIGNANFTDENAILDYNKRNQEMLKNTKFSINIAVPPNTSAKASTPTNSSQVQESVQNTIQYYDNQLSQLSTINSSIAASTAGAGTLPTGTGPIKAIPYFFLGDLIESILKDMYGSNKTLPEKQLKVILGPIKFFDYGNIREINSPLSKPSGIKSVLNGTPVKFYTGREANINISDIPIAVSTYSNWFLKNIVDNGTNTMTFRDFLSLLINDLVLRACTIDTYSQAPRQKVVLSFRQFVLPESDNPRFPIQPSGFRYKVDDYIKLSGRFTTDKNVFYDSETRIKLDNFLFIFANGNTEFQLLSNYEEDIKKGIRHLYYGNETGMVKKINFKRIDNEHMRASRIMKASNFAADGSVILRQFYDADIDMFGNNFFNIGDIVYVSPTLFGISKKGKFFADREAATKDLGIGGYFQVLNVKNTISDGSYNTSLTCKWFAKGDGVPLNVGDNPTTPTSKGFKVI